MRALILISALAFLFAETALAQQREPIVTDRPDQTESASIVPAGWLQIEAGVLREKGENEVSFASAGTYLNWKATTEGWQIPGILLRIGLSKQLELRFGFGYVSDDSYRYGLLPPNAISKTTADGAPDTKVEGLDAFSLGTKVRISDENGWIPQSAILASVTLPSTGAKHFESEWLVPEIRFAFAHTLSDRFSVGYNLAAMWDGNSARHIGYYSFVIGAGLIYDLSCYAELYGDLPGDSSPLHRFDAGLTYLITDDLQLDASYGLGLSEPANDASGMDYLFAMDSYMSAGFSWRFPVW